MFDYWFDSPPTTGSALNDSVMWDQNPLYPLAPGLLTPFSYSIVAEITRRGWFQYYDRLGFEPTPGATLVRQHRGFAYLNRSISSVLDSNAAAIEPAVIHVNGKRFPLASWEKPGLLGSIKSSRSQKQIDNLLKELSVEAVAATQKAKDWYENLLTLKWSQADILQVMEQIERVGSDSLMIFFAARHNLELLYNRLYWATQEQLPYPLNLQQIVAACSNVSGLVEQEMVEQIHALRASLVSAGTFADFRTGVARCGREDEGAVGEPIEPKWTEALQPFLERFGHRGIAEGEVRNLRWSENPLLLLHIVAGGSKGTSSTPLTFDADGAREALISMIDAKQQKQARKWLGQIPELMRLQSLALHAFSYVQAGTRQWALAAAQEAMTDNRLTDPDEIYFYALEEAKEMMTGEWNVSATDEIRAVAAQRRKEYDEWRQAEPAPILLNDAEGKAGKDQLGASPVSIVGGCASGTFARIEPNGAAATLAETGADKVVIGLEQIECGSAVLLPEVGGILSANGAFLSPSVSIAARHQIPVRMNARQQIDSLLDDAPTTVREDAA